MAFIVSQDQVRESQTARTAFLQEQRERQREHLRNEVARCRGEAQSLGEALRERREAAPTLNTAQTLVGDVEIDMLARKYQNAIAALEAAEYACGEDA